MAYLPELHRCCVCGIDLGPDNGDGICIGCEDEEETMPDDLTPTESDRARDLRADLEEFQRRDGRNWALWLCDNAEEIIPAAIRRALAAEAESARVLALVNAMQRAAGMQVTDGTDGDPVRWLEGMRAELGRLKAQAHDARCKALTCCFCGLGWANLGALKTHSEQCPEHPAVRASRAANEENKELHRKLQLMADRVAAQSELLTKRAEGRADHA